MSRSHYIDRLRAGAVLLLFVYHGAQIFSHFQCYVENREKSLVLALTVQFLFQWHMHLLFALAGMASFYSLAKRSSIGYLGERSLRLLVPLVFGVLVIVPPLKYLLMGRLTDSAGSYLAMYRHWSSFLTPSGDAHWAHLWFIAYLAIYSVLALPMFRRLSRGMGGRLTGVIAAGCDRWGGVLALGLLPALLEAGLRPGWPGGMFNVVDDWATVFVYLAYFVLGYLLVSDERFGRSLDRSLGLAAVLAVVLMAGYFGLLVAGVVREPRLNDPHPYTAAAVMFQLLRGLNSWCWVVMMVAGGRRYLNGDGGRVLAYLTRASYPVYILHATVIMLIAHRVVEWSAGPLVKFIAIMVLSYPAVFIVYDLFVRRSGPTRFLFGMRVLEKARPSQHHDATTREEKK